MSNIAESLHHYSHRVMRHTDGKGNFWFDIREVYFNAAGEVTGWTADPDHPGGEELHECQGEYERMGDAFDYPILDEWTLPGYDGPVPSG